MVASIELQNYSYKVALNTLSFLSVSDRMDRRLMILHHAIEDALHGDLSEDDIAGFMFMALSVANRKSCTTVVKYAANVCLAALSHNAPLTIFMSDILFSTLSKNCEIDETCADLMEIWNTDLKSIPSKIPLSVIMMKGHA
ncbi:hypothetical protein MTBPR1_140049 [Candidatus Terasakiella magnetica]|uniref:Uncharacterized protein n=1 Tax=Candidatus Terasakiella magnetica TaxID=1867952 RepID=A0A1C3RFA2_9PROT|nr:hypothetical protein [Candidatus Terasakiella magnetica]SCA55931.1 hypothetical protein MTBPR1_140049 [Candidatus Terasakiella magnetica]